jgi:hypothetical protein
VPAAPKKSVSGRQPASATIGKRQACRQVGLRDLVPERRRTTATVALAACVVGTVGTVWMILGDLFTAVHRDAALPGPLNKLLPAMLEIGLVVLLIQLATLPPRRIPCMSQGTTTLPCTFAWTHVMPDETASPDA